MRRLYFDYYLENKENHFIFVFYQQNLYIFYFLPILFLTPQPPKRPASTHFNNLNVFLNLAWSY